jgi:hypothetical protein
MTYGTEVGTCQFGVYQHLKKNPHLIARRTVGEDPDLTPILLREQGNPVDPLMKKPSKEIIQASSCLLEF